MKEKDTVQITLTTYFHSRQEEKQFTVDEFLKENFSFSHSVEKGSLTWLHLSGVRDVEILEKILSPYDIHELVIEDILTESQQTKAEIYSGYLFFVCRSFHYSLHSSLKYHQLFILVFPQVIFTFDPKSCLYLENIYKNFNIKNREQDELNTGFLSYVLLDEIINQSYPAINALLERIEKTDQKLFASGNHLTLNKVHKIKQNATRMRRSLRRMNDTLQQIMRWEHHLIDQHSKEYFRDLVDMSAQMCDRIDYANEVIQSITGTYLNIQSNQLNIQMRLLTVVNIIFMPLSLLAGIYGMNFDDMPQIHNPYGYYILLGVMVMITITLLTIFKKKNWL